MAKLEDLIKEIADSKLRDEIAREVAQLKSEKKFGLVFEEHIPELAQLSSLPPRVGDRVCKRGGKTRETFRVVAPVNSRQLRIVREPDGKVENIPAKQVVVVKRFGEPIYPAFVPVDRVTRAPGKPYHTIINADNYHALQLLLYTCEGQVDVIYIDPPYNTGARDWKYNNDYVDRNDQYQHSKWLAMMKKRLLLAMRLLKQDGIMCITIDDYEVHHLRSLIEDYLPQAVVLGTVVVKTSPSGRPTVRGFRGNHEYALFVSKNKNVEIGKLEKSEDQLALFKEQDAQGSFAWANMRKRGGANTHRKARPRQFYPIYVSGESIRIPKLEWVKSKKEWKVLQDPKRNEEVVLPLDEKGGERIWALGHETARQQLSDLRVHRDKEGKAFVYRKLREGNGSLPSTWWEKPMYSVVENGTVLLEKILGSGQKFPFPKSLYAVVDCLRVAGAANKKALIVDFFAGSATTFHATCLLNAEDDGNRQSIIVTNNEVDEILTKELNEQGYFPGDDKFEAHGICESVTFPRCKYVVNGKRDDGTELPGTYLDGREMKEGFEENLEYCKLDFLDPHHVAYGDKFEAILPILWMMAGAQGERETARGYSKWFIPKHSPYAVLIEEDAFSDFKRELKRRPDITHVFLVTDSEEAYREMIADLPGTLQTKMLYKSYLDNFKINTETISG